VAKQTMNGEIVRGTEQGTVINAHLQTATMPWKKYHGKTNAGCC